MKNVSAFIIILMVIALWTCNIFLLNSLSTKEKEFNTKRRTFQEIHRSYESIVLQYDAIVDLGKIREEMLKKGFRRAGKVNYFEIEGKESQK